MWKWSLSQIRNQKSEILVSLVIDDRDAVYPLSIDPLLINEQTTLTGSDAAADDLVGWSVAVSGDTAVVGAYGKANRSSAASDTTQVLSGRRKPAARSR